MSLLLGHYSVLSYAGCQASIAALTAQIDHMKSDSEMETSTLTFNHTSPPGL